MGILATARRACWDAIENYDATKSLFATTFKFDEDVPTLKEIELRPAFSQIPALAIFPESAAPLWDLNQRQSWPYRLGFTAWFPGWSVSDGEDAFESIIVALYKSAPKATPTVSYIKAATGYHAIRVLPLTFDRLKLGENNEGPHAVRLKWGLELKLVTNPLA